MMPDNAGLSEMIQIMNQDNGMAKLIQEPVYAPGNSGEPNVSQADIIADLFNVARLDLKRIGEELGLEMEVERMTPAKAAVMMQNMVQGDSLELIEKFNELEAKRERILATLLESEDEFDVHGETKARIAHSRPDAGPALDDGSAEPDSPDANPGENTGETTTQEGADGAGEADTDATADNDQAEVEPEVEPEVEEEEEADE